MHLATLAVLFSCLILVDAHVALWDKGMFGYNYPNQASEKNQDYNNNAPVTPLRQSDGLTVDEWFGHGYKSFPPVSGDFLTLPSGGTYNGEIQCNRAQTKMGNPVDPTAKPQYACDGEGALHTTNRFGQSVNVKAFGGTSLGIAYTSDVNSLKPNDMTIISVNYASPWTRLVSYKIPAGMPPCPSGGCICSWNWIHRAGNGEGYGQEIYNLLYRCKVTGSTNANNVVQRGAVPVDCTGNSAKCMKGPKTGLYLYQRDGNNLPSLDVPPTYTADWGFSDGAQNDIFSKSSNPAGDDGLINPYATGTGTKTYSDPPPTATAIPSGWKSVGCTVDSNTRYLTTQAYSLTTNTISMCVSKCDSLGFSAAGLEGGRECWCGNPTKSPTMAPDSECDSRCPGDIFAFCGGSWRSNLYTKQAATASTTKAATTTKAAATSTAVDKTSTTAAASPSSSIPAGWRSLGCHGEKSGSRMLSADRTESSSMTAAKCIAYCSGKGYKYVGLQYMTQCYCGNTFTENPTSGCDSKCAGDKSQICGGAYKNTVYTSVAATKRSLDDDEDYRTGLVERILAYVPEGASSLMRRSADEASGAIETIRDWVPWTSRPDTETEVAEGFDIIDHSILERSFDPTSDSGDVEPVEDWEPWPMRMAAEKAAAASEDDADVARIRRRHFARPRGRDLDRRY